MARTARPVRNLVEEQVLRWRAEQQAQAPRTTPPPSRPHVVTFAHQLGSNAAEIAAAVAAQLGIPLYDREILQYIADSAEVQVETVETLDEQVQNRLQEYITALLYERNFHPSDYLLHLARAICALWEHGSCVLVGHGCVHVVPRTHALAVRVVAPEQARIKRVAEREQIELEDARRLTQRTDSERQAFHRRNFHADCDDSRNYDLVIDSNSFDTAGCAAVIVEAFRRKFTA
jgi:cytidylate kinase